MKFYEYALDMSYKENLFTSFELNLKR